VIFATTNPAVAALLQETQTIPIVFTLVSDSVGSGFVPSLAHPGGNITGFHNFEMVGNSQRASWIAGVTLDLAGGRVMV
jgi:ABC-type uncharacterized transport system substrate-binding protein